MEEQTGEIEQEPAEVETPAEVSEPTVVDKVDVNEEEVHFTTKQDAPPPPEVEFINEPANISIISEIKVEEVAEKPKGKVASVTVCNKVIKNEELDVSLERKLALRPRKPAATALNGKTGDNANKTKVTAKKNGGKVVRTPLKSKCEVGQGNVVSEPPILVCVSDNSLAYCHESTFPPVLPLEQSYDATCSQVEYEKTEVAVDPIECGPREMPLLESETVDKGDAVREQSESETRISSTSDNSNNVVKIVKKRKRRKRLERKKGKKGAERKRKLNGAVNGHESDLTVSTGDDCDHSGQTSPSLSEHSAAKRRKGSGDESSDNSHKKSREFAVPSPSLADISVKAAIPESTATSLETGAAKPGLCLCRKKPQVYVSGSSARDLFCQALDTIDSRVVGCCNPIPSQDVALYRASEKACFQMLCSVHQQRLLRHNCCPGCGLFCSQGRYLMCSYMHHYHRGCYLDDTEVGYCICPHCGDDAIPKSVVMTLQAAKDPILLPQQKPPRLSKSAKMSVTRGMSCLEEEDWDVEISLPPASILAADEAPLAAAKYTYKALREAASCGDVEKLLRMVASGLNVNGHLDEGARCAGQTALHVAAAHGHLSFVHVLLQAQAQVDALDAEHTSPLVMAIVAGHNPVVKYLVRCGASLMLKSEDGMTPLHIAAKCGNVVACHHLLNGKTLPPRYVDCVDDGGWTPMVWAAEFNHLAVVRFLMSKGSDPGLRDTEQNIALHWAAFGGSLDIVELFLNHGSDVNAVNVHGDTPLHIAARQDKYNCALLLLARGAKSTLRNKANEQARDCAESQQCAMYRGISLNMEIAALLVRYKDRAPRIISNDISMGKERNQIQCVNSVDDALEPRDYLYVSESCYTSRISMDRTITSLQHCQCAGNCSNTDCNCAHISIKCWYDNEGKLKPEFSYAEPPMIFECNQACRCNRITCNNRVVQNGITCRVQLFRTETKGWGIRTLGAIPKGTYVCEYIGEIISDCEADHREDDSYLFDLDNRDGETYCIDARRYGNFARFINHMCVPNLMPVHVFVEHQDLRFPRIAFFANRDIAANEELGYNYGAKFWVIKWKSFTCTCGADKCIYSDKTIKTTLDNYKQKMDQLEEAA